MGALVSNTPKLPLEARVGNKTLSLVRNDGYVRPGDAKFVVALRPITLTGFGPTQSTRSTGGIVGRFKRYPIALECFNEVLVEMTAAFILGED